MDSKIVVVGGVLLALLFLTSGGTKSIAQIGGSETTARGTWTLTGFSPTCVTTLPPGYGGYVTKCNEEFSYTWNGVDTGWAYRQYAFKNAGGDPYYCSYGGSDAPLNNQCAVDKTLISKADSSLDAMQTAKFTNVYVKDFANPDASPYSNAPKILYDASIPVSKDVRVWLDSSSCPAPEGMDLSQLTLTYQVFDGSKPTISFSDFKHSVVRFCMSQPISVKLSSGAVQSVVSPYGDLVVKGSYALPGGETQVWQYLAPASEFPSVCPSGSSLVETQYGTAVEKVCVGAGSATPTAPAPVQVSTSCSGTLTSSGDCVYASQTTASCGSGTVYNELSKQCEAQSEFCASGSSVTASPSGFGNSTYYCSDGSTVDAKGVCVQLLGSGASYMDGKCQVAPSVTQSPQVVNPVNYVPSSSGGVSYSAPSSPSSSTSALTGLAGQSGDVFSNPLVVLALLAALGAGGYVYFIKK